jgi:NitT/TauT family transport system permease protein
MQSVASGNSQERERMATHNDVQEPGVADDVSHPRRALSPQGRALVIVLAQIVILVAVLGSWQLTVDHGLIDPLFTSRPSAIGASFWQGLRHGQLLSALGTSLYETMIGYLISVVAGFLVAVALYVVPTLHQIFQPFISGLNSLPRIALAPLFILWFGIGPESRIALIVSLTFFIILLNTYAGLQNCDRDHLILARSLGARTRQKFAIFMLPSAAPAIFAGLQLGLAYSFLGAVVAEIISGGSGLGALLSINSANYDTAGMFADLLVMAIVSAVLAGLMTLLERYLLSWRRFEYRGVSA